MGRKILQFYPSNVYFSYSHLECNNFKIKVSIFCIISKCFYEWNFKISDPPCTINPTYMQVLKWPQHYIFAYKIQTLYAEKIKLLKLLLYIVFRKKYCLKFGWTGTPTMTSSFIIAWSVSYKMTQDWNLHNFLNVNDMKLISLQ